MVDEVDKTSIHPTPDERNPDEVVDSLVNKRLEGAVPRPFPTSNLRLYYACFSLNDIESVKPSSDGPDEEGNEWHPIYRAEDVDREIERLQRELWVVAECIFQNVSSDDAKHWALGIKCSITQAGPSFTVETSPNPWEETAAQFARNADYYRGLLDRIGRAIGPEAFTADDGSISEDVLRAKVPEIIESRFAQETSEKCCFRGCDELPVARIEWGPICYTHSFRKFLPGETVAESLAQKVILCDGKYTFRCTESGFLVCDRYNEKGWRDFFGDKAVHALFDEVIRLREKARRSPDTLTDTSASPAGEVTRSPAADDTLTVRWGELRALVYAAWISAKTRELPTEGWVNQLINCIVTTDSGVLKV